MLQDEKCSRHEEEIKELQHDMVSVKLKLTEIQSDTQYIKQRLDNGLMKSMTELTTKLAELCPRVVEHGYWIDKVKWGTAMITIVAVGGGLVAFVIKVIENG